MEFNFNRNWVSGSMAIIVSLGIANVGFAKTSIELDHLAQVRVVDLTHSLNENTVFWPTAPVRFKLLEVFKGFVNDLFFYSANTMELAEHGGTHIDAPIHFAPQGQTVSEIPIDRLMAEAVVLDISKQAAENPDYRLTLEDVKSHERLHGPIPDGSIILLRTDWSKKYGDLKAYLGDDTPGDDTKLSFPSLGQEAVSFLLEKRAIKAIGVDVASIDYGKSRDFPVHQLMAKYNIPGFENLTHLDQLPARGAFLFALPAKIEKGSGGPIRAIGLVKK